MATTKLVDNAPSSLAAEPSNPEPEFVTNQKETQVLSSSEEVGVIANPVPFEPDKSKDGAGPLALEYPTVETSMEQSSSQVMYGHYACDTIYFISNPLTVMQRISARVIGTP